MSVILSESLETFTISESSSDLITKLVRQLRELNSFSMDNEFFRTFRGNSIELLLLVNNLIFYMFYEFVEFISDGFTMPVLVVFNIRKSLAFESLSNDDSRLTNLGFSIVERFNDGFDVMSIDDNGIPAESLKSLLVDICLVSK
jgi:hypothetical protein